MEIWDRGSYEAHEWTDDRIVVTFHGQRLRGRYNLIRFKGERQRLLFKGRDE